MLTGSKLLLISLGSRGAGGGELSWLSGMLPASHIEIRSPLSGWWVGRTVLAGWAAASQPCGNQNGPQSACVWDSSIPPVLPALNASPVSPSWDGAACQAMKRLLVLFISSEQEGYLDIDIQSPNKLYKSAVYSNADPFL